MAIVTPGPMVAAASGSIGGTVFSHNKGGMYVRNRAIPTTSTTSDALAAKARLQAASNAYQDLTAAQRAAWLEWAAANPFINALGASKVIPALAAHNSIYTRLAQSGDTVLTSPPASPAPGPLLTLSVAAQEGGTCALTFTATPLGAAEKLWTRAVKLQSASINYVENLLRVVDISAAAQATGLDIATEIAAKYGAMLEGETIILTCAVFDTATGLLSEPLRAKATVAAAA